MFGINPSEFVVLLVVAAVVLGPERLPHYAQQLARLIRELRRMAQGAADQVRAEMGPEFDDVDWRKLDPRQYDPRRIVREALSDVIDPDDPLGLNAPDDKPASAGGPASVDERASGVAAGGTGNGSATGTGSATGSGSATGNGAGTVEATGKETAGPAGTAVPAPEVPFDPDAT